MSAGGDAAPGPRTVAERSGFTRTSLHADVCAFLAEVAAGSDRIRLLDMGQSGEGRPIPVAVLSSAGAFTPAAAQALGKPVVLVLANIHAGEVEGKEALLDLARDVAAGHGGLGRMRDDLTLLLVPDYNPDGNDRIDTRNRALDLARMEGQLGPEGGVGTRTTAAGINLNRDYTKLEAVESRALASLVAAWRPHAFVDCHATDGSIHGYDLTFDTAHNPASGPPGPIALVRDRLLPGVAASLRARTGIRTGFYGNFVDPADPARGWETYPALPRYGSHYRGLMGRLDVLLEAYSYIDFRARHRAMLETIVEVLDALRAGAGEALAVVREAEAATVAAGRDPVPADRIAVSHALAVRDPATGRLELAHPAAPLRAIDIEAWDLESMLARRLPGRERRTYASTYLARFVPTREVARPRGYLVTAAAAARVGDLLRRHGLAIEEVAAPRELDVEAYTVVTAETIASPDLGAGAAGESRLEVRAATGRGGAAPGDLVVTTAQPLAHVAIHLLEPESDDGFAHWGLLGPLAAGDRFPVLRLR